jgi:hypothetical protein
MELFKIVVSENSKMIYKSVQGTRLNAVNETIRNIRMSRYKPKEGNSWFISIEQQYMDQCGMVKIKHTKGGLALNRSFVIHANEFNYELLESEMIERFVKK